MSKKSFFFILSAFLFSGIFAQEDTTTMYGNINEVVITATRARTGRNSIPATISVIGRDEIGQSSESALLPVLSAQVPGMFVTQRGITGFGVSSGGTGGITLRGVGGSPTTGLLVLIDGHPQYMGIMGHHLPDAYVASDVEKVEVIRGPASILYGSNAMGGVINIITRKQEQDGWSVGGRVMYGSHNTQKYMAGAGLKKGRFNGYISVNHDRTDGHRTNSKFNITNGYTKLGYRISEHVEVWGDVSLAKYQAQNPGTVSSPMIDNIADIIRGVASVTVDNRFEKTDGAFKFFYNFGDHEINDGYAAGGEPKNFRFRSDDHNYGITLYQVFRPFRGNMLTAGFDFKNFGGHARNDFIDGNIPDAKQVDTASYEVAGYLIMQQTLFDKLTLNAGLRLENNRDFGAEWVPQAGLAYRPLRHTVFKVSVAKGFRSPTIRELYYIASWAGANPDLKPERMVNYEASVGQSFLKGRLSAELTGFIADGSNMIIRNPETGANSNSGDFNNSGFELSVKWNVLRNLRIHTNYSHLHMDNPKPFSPEQQFYFSASYRLKKWTVSADYRYVHKLYSNSELTATESYGLLNAKAACHPLKWLDVFVKAENLTDKNYQIVNEYPMPGITVFGGINISLK